MDLKIISQIFNGFSYSVILNDGTFHNIQCTPENYLAIQALINNDCETFLKIVNPYSFFKYKMKDKITEKSDGSIYYENIKIVKDLIPLYSIAINEKYDINLVKKYEKLPKNAKIILNNILNFSEYVIDKNMNIFIPIDSNILNNLFYINTFFYYNLLKKVKNKSKLYLHFQFKIINNSYLNDKKYYIDNSKLTSYPDVVLLDDIKENKEYREYIINDNIDYNKNEYCKLCGKQLKKFENEYCSVCENTKK